MIHLVRRSEQASARRAQPPYQIENGWVYMMNLQQEINQICSNVQLLTGVFCTPLESRTRQTRTAEFPCGCRTKALRHLNGGTRFHGQRHYGCSCGALYIETVLFTADSGEACGLLAGPIQTEGCGCLCRKDIPYLHPEAVEALTSTLHSLCEHLVCGTRFLRCETREEPSGKEDRPLDSERRLQQLIREGDQNQAQELLNLLLLEMY